jgi:hypothetical protein
MGGSAHGEETGSGTGRRFGFLGAGFGFGAVACGFVVFGFGAGVTTDSTWLACGAGRAVVAATVAWGVLDDPQPAAASASRTRSSERFTHAVSARGTRLLSGLQPPPVRYSWWGRA